MTPQEILELPLTQEWLAYLENNPGKQHASTLGYVDPETKELTRACCLGAYLYLSERKSLVTRSISHEDSSDTEYSHTCIILDGVLPVGRDYKSHEQFLIASYKKLHLRTETGQLAGLIQQEWKEEYFSNEFLSDWNLKSLANMNDCKISWPRIADFIRNNPEQIFRDWHLSE